MSDSATQASIHYLVTRAEQMQEEVFSSPPADWGQFQERLGAWRENQAMQLRLATIEKGIEDGL